MPVLARSELEASPLADLHTIADQLGLDGFRRLRKADLIDAILADGSTESIDSDGEDAEQEPAQEGQRPRRRRGLRARRSTSSSRASDDSTDARGAGGEAEGDGGSARASEARSTEARSTEARSTEARSTEARSTEARSTEARSTEARASEARASEARASEARASDGVGRIAAGVVELLGNGSAFLRVTPPEPSDEDVYISAAQVRRCELVSGDRVTGPVRTPRRSERYPSLVRIDTINGSSADSVADGSRYEDLPVAWPNERLALGSEDPTLHAIEWLTPLGRGSRAVIVGSARAGKTTILRRMVDALAGQDELTLSVVLCGVRPEEVADWQDGPVAPVASSDFAASADSQNQHLERAVDTAKRIASRGGHALLAVDSLDGLHPHAARRALAAARNLREGGSLTVIATATQPLGGETTVIALDAALTSAGRQPILDLPASGTLRPELLVGEDGAAEITKARAAALEG